MEGYRISLVKALAELLRWPTLLGIVALVLIALVAGATFGIWRGYDPAAYSAQTFLEVHQGAVGGLNILLPAMAFGSIALTAILAIRSYNHSPAFLPYVIAVAAMVAAGLTTRFGNQPINAIVMGWSASTMPPDWTALRDSWWHLHVLRTLLAMGGMLTLLLAVLIDRRP